MKLRASVALVVLCLGLAPAGTLIARGNFAPGVRVSTTTLSIPTYNYSSFLYPEHSNAYNLDYYKLNWGAYEGSGPHPEPHDYTAVVVENSWLRLTFLPELGGRLYGVRDLSTGDELLYQNPVVKPTHWGPPEQGWWLAAGGIEWCLPVEEHGYEWGVPWAYTVTTSVGGATVALWDTTAVDRLRARIEVHLPADRAAFTITPRIENPTGAPVSFKFWENAMLAPGPQNTVGQELRFVFPIDQVTLHSRGDGYLPGEREAMSWPVYNGTDYSRLGNWNQWLGFFARPQAAADWVGVYAEAVRRGVARLFPHDIAAGVKGFGMGWQNQIDPVNWTDDGTTYVELHGGPSPTFWDSLTLPAGQAIEWTETWLPLRDLPRLTFATPDAALGLKAEGADLEVGVALDAQGNDVSLRLWRASDCTLLWRQDGLALAPGAAYTTQLAGLGDSAGDVVLGVLKAGQLLAMSGDLSCPLSSSQVSPLATAQATADFTVQWTAVDPGGVVAAYDVQVRDGDVGAAWTGWLSGTTAGSAVFHGQDGHTYTFRSRVRDLWGRVEPWPAGAWQDAFTTVLLQPAPTLITSEKIANPHCVQTGDEVEFEIRLRNTGSLAADVALTDPIPAGLEVVGDPWISPELPPPSLSGGTLTWNGSLASGGSATIGFTARVPAIVPGQKIANTVSIEDGVHPLLSRQASVAGCKQLYLPLIGRSS